MEQWLQARLLQRTTRSVTLTDAGENALRRCQQMLALSQDLEEETATTTEGALRGQLRLTCSVSFAFAQMGAAIADFLAQHPQLKIDLDASEGSLNLVEKRIDLAIRISAEPDPLLIGRPHWSAAIRPWWHRPPTWPRTVCRSNLPTCRSTGA